MPGGPPAVQAVHAGAVLLHQAGGREEATDGPARNQEQQRYHPITTVHHSDFPTQSSRLPLNHKSLHINRSHSAQQEKLQIYPQNRPHRTSLLHLTLPINSLLLNERTHQGQHALYSYNKRIVAFDVGEGRGSKWKAHTGRGHPIVDKHILFYAWMGGVEGHQFLQL